MDVSEAGSGEDIYGDPTVASIEGTNLDLTMYTGVGSEFSIREAGDVREQEFETSPPFPVDPIAAGAPEPERNNHRRRRSCRRNCRREGCKGRAFCAGT